MTNAEAIKDVYDFARRYQGRWSGFRTNATTLRAVKGAEKKYKKFEVSWETNQFRYTGKDNG